MPTHTVLVVGTDDWGIEQAGVEGGPRALTLSHQGSLGARQRLGHRAARRHEPRSVERSALT